VYAQMLVELRAQHSAMWELLRSEEESLSVAVGEDRKKVGTRVAVVQIAAEQGLNKSNKAVIPLRSTISAYVLTVLTCCIYVCVRSCICACVLVCLSDNSDVAGRENDRTSSDDGH
jgi:hypothetical protein